MLLRSPQGVWKKTLSCRQAVISRRLYTTRTRDPLRILFCGSDEFSCASLKAVHQAQHELNIRSIDVMCRPGKPSGRGLKVIKDVPLKSVAQDLGLNIHERDTFTGWDIPSTEGVPINLLIAVSFGLFVPRRILQSVEYGGLNVHPSLLPDLRGPAPLHHTLLRGDAYTGITLQTLDPEKFDHGKILLQNRFPVGKSGGEGAPTYPELLEKVSDEGPRILVQGLREGAYLPGYALAPHLKLIPREKLDHAPKITNADREIDFHNESVEAIVRKERVLGRVWCTARLKTGETKRLILSGLESLSPTTVSRENRIRRQEEIPTLGIYPASKPAHKICMLPGEDDQVFLALEGDRMMSVGRITVEGERPKPARHALYGDSEQGRGRGAYKFHSGPDGDVTLSQEILSFATIYFILS